jgi:lipid-binding SYLF domain-containing protein
MNRSKKMNHGKIAMALIATATLFLLSGVRPAHANEVKEARQLVERADMTFENFEAAPEMDAFRDLLHRAKGVFIAPQVLKGAFVLGVSGGNGVLLTRGETSSAWHGPAFYTIGEVSYGLQLGGEASEVILLAMTEKGVTAMLANSLKLGADVGVAAGPVGMGASADTANLSADIVSFSRSKGAFGGVSVNGAVVAVRPGLNHAFYGGKLDPTDILIRHRGSNRQASRLIAAVAKGAAKHRKSRR